MDIHTTKSQKNDVSQYRQNCIICGEKLVCGTQSEIKKCAICHKDYQTNTVCLNGHYVCDSCHSLGVYDLLPFLKNSTEKDPVKLIQKIMNHTSVHMHGPEHHSIVPCVLLTAFKNCGGDIDLDTSLKEAIYRGRQVPGGICGYWGACGAAIGAGIFTSIVKGSTPLNKEAWPIPNLVTAHCLQRIADVGGPRCCKRTSYIAIKTAVELLNKYFGVSMPVSKIQCRHSGLNKECLKSDCPFFNTKEV